MDRKKMLEAMKKTYQSGYKAGFADACDLMKDDVANLVVSMEKSLDDKTFIVDEQKSPGSTI